MSEMTIGITACLSLLGLVLACFFYMWGGREGKWKRRFIASFILALTVNLASLVMQRWVWQLCFIFPVLITSFSLGYGGDDLIIKIFRRTLYALAVVGSGLLFCFFVGGKCWWVLPAHLGVGLFSVWLGVKNPVYAAAEEVFVCALLNLGLCIYPFVG